jgi:heme exporter protein D
MTNLHTSAALPALEARVAARLAGLLTTQSQALPHDLSERLRFAREQALSRARQARLQTASGAVVQASGGGTAALGGFGRFSGWWVQAASVLPLLVLVSGLLLIDRSVTREQVRAAAEIDAQWLSDTLPPTAYSDPGFAEYLRSSPLP